MNFIDTFCCVCLNVKHILNQLFDKDNYGVSHYNKLISSIAEMDFNEVNNQRLKICEECCIYLNTVYDFRQMCLRNKTYLITYISQLQSSSQVSSTTNFPFTNVTQIEKQEIKHENEDSNFKFEQIYIPQGGSSEDNNKVSIKEKHESEEDNFQSKCTFEDATVDHVNESTLNNSNVKDVEHEPIKDEYNKNITEDFIDNTCEVIINETGTEKPFECEICKKSFIKKVHLNQHMLMHSDRKTFTCGVCDKKFTLKQNLTKHEQLHGEKLFQCNFCDKRFFQKFKLKNHLQTHSDERPFVCGVCDKKFTLKHNLTKHEQQLHGAKLFECSLCSKRFAQKFNLTRHLQTHANEQISV